VHATVREAVAELGELRAVLSGVLSGLGLVAGGSGTHPSAVWHEMRVSSRERHQHVYGSMRELARREPTFALHVHVGVPSGEAGIAAFNRLRAHIPVLLALSANSPFWQSRDTGLASARTPLFQAFRASGSRASSAPTASTSYSSALAV
jgi:carboxylate-amine ligase